MLWGQLGLGASRGVWHDDGLRGRKGRCTIMYWYRQERGQGILEYSLIIALVVVVVLGTLILFGPQISSAFRTIGNAI